MNRNIWIGICIVALLIIGWAIYSSGKTTEEIKQPVTENTTSDTQVVQNTDSKTITGTPTQTFKSLITQKGSFKCTYEVASSTGKSTDIIYIADGKLRGEFRTSGMAGNMMIYDGVTLYQWKEGFTVGTKTLLTSLAQLPSVIPKDLTSGASYGAGIDSVGWDCHQWIKVSSTLIPPSAVKFTLTK